MESLVELESNFYQSGFEQGLEDGRRIGYLEGSLVGLEHSFHNLLSVGKIHGICQEWVDDQRITETLRKRAQLIVQLIEGLPLSNAEEKQIQFEHKIKLVFARFRQLDQSINHSLSLSHDILPPTSQNVAIDVNSDISLARQFENDGY